MLCMCISDNSIATNYGGCYSANETVNLEDGTSKSMADLQVGDHVLTLATNGETTYSPVLLFFHQNSQTRADFIKLHLTNGSESITLTPNHLIYFTTNNKALITDLTAGFARHAAVGTYLYLKDINGHFVFKTIEKVETLKLNGIYAPLTKEGTVVVNNVYTSCYAHINHHGIAHTMLAPFRWLHTFDSWLGESQHLNTADTVITTSSGVHWYAEILHSLAPYVIPHYLLYSS